MNKKLLIFLIAVSLFFFSFYFSFNYTKNTKEKTNILSSESMGEDKDIVGNNEISITFSNDTFTLSWINVFNIENLYLIDNFDNWITSNEAINKHSCTSLVNAGFYDQKRSPIGLFISDGRIINEKVKNNTFNGFLTINEYLIPRITDYLPKDPIKMGVQSGPLLISNDSGKVLSINNDKMARRIVAATTGSNELLFIVIYIKDNVYSGPYLEDLPQILDLFEKESNVLISDAINLDGATASCFISDTVSLTELAPVGSYFCIK